MQKTQAEIGDIQIKQQLSALDKQIAQANSETERGKLQLERDKLVQQQQMNGQSVQQDTQQQLETVQNGLSTVKSILSSPALDESSWTPGIGSGPVSGIIGKVSGWMPGTEMTDMKAKIETLKSQQFLNQAKALKGMGALSDAEGARIERAVASLDPDQSAKSFKGALNVIQSTLERAQNKLVASGKLPTAGGAFVMQHPVYGNVSEGDINKLMAAHPGSTREQVIQYLNQTKGGQ
jgi:hypothetical protein